MPPRRLTTRLYPALLLLTVAPLLGAVAFASRSMRSLYYAEVERGLEVRAHLVESELGLLLDDPGDPRLATFCRELATLAGTRVTVVAPDGRVVADTAHDPARMDNHNGRPEVITARRVGLGRATRHSDTAGQSTIYVAVLLRGERTSGYVLRTGVPLTQLGRSLGAMRQRLLLLGLGLALLAGGLSLLLGRQLSRPLEEMRHAAEAFARGNLSRRIPVAETVELGGLATALNEMAGELEARVRTVEQQRRELEAVLASMVEGVLAVDAEERILRLNRAAAELFEVDPATVVGRTVPEVLRSSELQRFVARALTSTGPVDATIVLRQPAEVELRATGTRLHDASGRPLGALVVLDNVTRLRRLEAIRRDFVANVSHELRTPITAIKGFLETLQEGDHDPDAQRHFLAIAYRQADRLHHIIEDLLTLSKVEQSDETRQIQFEDLDVAQVVRAAAQACTHAAAEQGITLEVPTEPLPWHGSAALLEEAVVNLLDNAIKYSPPGSTVRIEGSAGAAELVLRVIDQGAGIAPEHLPRLFERFYRVDKARSRSLGGTGLGLAIVKHIVAAHGGQVTVESAPGEGSTFQIILPRREG